MEQFRCGQVHLGCDARFSAASAEEVLRQVTLHAWQSHSLHAPHLPAGVVRDVLAAITTEITSRGSTTLPPEPSMVDVTAAAATGLDVTGRLAVVAARPTLSVGPRSAGSWSLGTAH